MHLQQLNDDCLELIIKLLTLDEQLVFALVTPALKSVIGTVWLRKYIKSTTLCCADHIEKVDVANNKAGVAAFGSVVCENIEEMNVTNAGVFNQLAKNKWPKLRHINVCVDFSAEAQKIQFVERRFPALESVDIIWDVKDFHYTAESTGRTRLRGAEMKLFYDMEAIETSTSFIRDLQKCHNVPDVVLGQMAELFRIMKRYDDEIDVTDNFLWSQKFEIIRLPETFNPKRIIVVGTDTESLSLQRTPELQELRLLNPDYAATAEEVTTFRAIMAHVAGCVENHVRQNMRQQPLQVNATVRMII